MLVVLIIAAFIIIVPQNLYSTISSKSFITYMGIGNSDIRMDVQQTEKLSEKANEIIKVISNDPAISKYTLLTTKSFIARMDDGTEERLNIELGDHTVFPVQYSEGRAPGSEDEIALSKLNAEQLEKKVGDRITLEFAGKEKKFTVSGIYSDITNGGKTAKAVFNDNTSDTMWHVIYLELRDKSYVGEKVKEYGEKFSYAKVSDVDEYIKQTYGTTSHSLGEASFAAMVVAVIISALVTLLFMKLHIGCFH